MATIRDRYPMYFKGHPKLYFKRKPIFWWTEKWVHARFILREMTSVGVAWFALVLIMMISALRSGEIAFAQFMEWLQSPFSIVLNILAFLLLLYHSYTWFKLAPKAIVIRMGVNKVPAFVIAGLNYGAWVVLSVAILIYFLNY